MSCTVNGLPDEWTTPTRFYVYTPNAPTALAQYRSDGVTVLAAGAFTEQTSANFKFNVSSPGPNQWLTPYVQLSTSSTFTGTCGSVGTAGAVVSAPTASTSYPASVTVGGLANNVTYYWRACAMNNGGIAGASVIKGGAPDFRTDRTAPTPNPTTGSAVANSTTQVTFTIDAASDGAGVGMHATPYSFDGGATWQAGTTFVQAGTANTQQTKSIRVRDALGNLTSASAVSRYTLPGAPTGLTATPSWSPADGYRVSLAWTAPAGGAASYDVRWSADGYAGSQGTSASTARIQQFLAPNTSYTYKVCATNPDGVTEAVCSATATATTPPGPPTAITPTASDTNVSFAFTPAAAAATTTFTLYTDAGCTTSAGSNGGASSPVVVAASRDVPYWYMGTSTNAGAVTGGPSTCTALGGNGRTAVTIGVDAGSVSLGVLGPGLTGNASSTVTVQTYGSTGYNLYASATTLADGGNTIPATASGTVGSPPGNSAGAWTGSGFGFTLASATNLEVGWGAGANWAAFNAAPQLIHATGAAFTANTVNSTATVVNYRVTIPGVQSVGTYSSTVTYSAVGTP